MARELTARSTLVLSRRWILAWYLVGIIFVALGIVQLTSGSGTVSRWVGGLSALVGGLVILTGAVIEHRRTRRR